MIANRTRVVAFVSTLVLISGICLGQVATSAPPFSSLGGGPFDTVNLANLNAHFAVPVTSKAGRGMPFSYALSYDNSVWYPVGVSGSQSWQPVLNWGWRGQTEIATGYVSYNSGTTKCFDDTGGWYWGQTINGYVYHDPWGVSHSFPISLRCGEGTSDAVASDGSGYSASFSNQITTPSGQKFTVPVNNASGAATTTDANGNQISVSAAGVFTDTLGTTALTVSGSGTPASPLTYAYTAPSGATASVAAHYTNKTVKTNFGCTGVSEYGPSTVALITDVTLPDGSQYTFQYEATPGFAGDITGRLASVTLPTGGTISYAYTGGSNGILCADGSTAGLTRTLSTGGSWTYARDNVSGTQWKTTITDPTTPTANQTVINFQKDSATANPTSNFYETERQVYQGAATGTPLVTIFTCYDGNSVATPANCPTTAVISPILRQTVFTYLPDASGLQAKVDTIYDSFGLVNQVSEYDFGSPAVGPLLRTTVSTYAALGNGIVDRPALVTILDSSSLVTAQTAYGYDEVAVTSTTATPQHITVSGSRGNLTTVGASVNSASALYRTFAYYDTGTLKSSTDASLAPGTPGASTTYTYSPSGSCGNSFATSISLPLSLSRSMQWNCTGAVVTSQTDENGKTSTTAYTDPSFWRPSSQTDQAGVTTSISYPTPNITESTLTFNAGNSVVDNRITVDGFGRPILSQTKQGPSATNYDSVETDYDVVGRVFRVTLPYVAAAGSFCSGSCPGTSTSYDALGRTTTVADNGGGSTTFTYVKNDVLQVIGPAPTGENTKQKQSEYDGLGRLTFVCEVTAAAGSGACGQSTAKTGLWTKYTYSTLDKLTGVTQNAQAAAGSQQTRAYAYDRLGRLTSEVNPESSGVTYSYDSLSSDSSCGTLSFPGNMVKRLDASSHAACYAYDSLHRLTATTYPGSGTPSRYRVYDTATVSGTTMANAAGRLAEAYTCTTCPATKITDLGFSYSARGETADVWQSTPHSAGYYHLTSAYWSHGAVQTLSGLPGLPTVYYGASDGSGLDGEGRVTKITVPAGSGQNPITGASYATSGTTQPIGALTQFTFGSADSDNFSFDPNTGRMNQYQFNVGSPAQSVVGNLTWNANGSLKTLQITDPFSGANAQTCNFSYDDLGRTLTANCGTKWNQTFSFDSFGNISKSATVGTSFQSTYAPSTNRITQIGSLTPQYDANGNLTNDTAHAYTWDGAGKMVTVDAGTASGVCLTYDALGRMVEQAKGTSCTSSYTQIVYGPAGNKLALMNGQTLTNASLGLLAGAEAVYNGGGLQYYRHPDWLGSSRFASTPARAKFYDEAYAPYGENYVNTTAPGFSFTGQKQDTGSWLYDFLFREYNPIHGRWMSPDPAGMAAANPANPQSWNRYAYVANNPLAVTDPLGLFENEGCGDPFYADSHPECPFPAEGFPVGGVVIIWGGGGGGGGGWGQRRQGRIGGKWPNGETLGLPTGLGSRPLGIGDLLSFLGGVVCGTGGVGRNGFLSGSSTTSASPCILTFPLETLLVIGAAVPQDSPSKPNSHSYATGVCFAFPVVQLRHFFGCSYACEYVVSVDPVLREEPGFAYFRGFYVDAKCGPGRYCPVVVTVEVDKKVTTQPTILSCVQ